MIVFNLSCERDHRFEGWFKSSDAYLAQRANAQVRCPVCDSAEISKLLTAPRLNISATAKLERAERDQHGDIAVRDKLKTPELRASSANEEDENDAPKTSPYSVDDAASSAISAATPTPPPSDWDGTPAQFALIDNAVRALRRKIKEQTEDVGGRFADVARAMHQGHEEARGIRGTVTPAQADALADEGIEAMAVPQGFFDDEQVH